MIDRRSSTSGVIFISAEHGPATKAARPTGKVLLVPRSSVISLPSPGTGTIRYESAEYHGYRILRRGAGKIVKSS